MSEFVAQWYNPRLKRERSHPGFRAPPDVDCLVLSNAIMALSTRYESQIIVAQCFKDCILAVLRKIIGGTVNEYLNSDIIT